MATKDSSFDIVSQVNLAEVDNAVNQADKEITQRFDFKGSKTTIERKENVITINTSDDFKMLNVIDILQTKLVKREVPLKAMEYGEIETSLGGRVKQEIKIMVGLEKEQTKAITSLIKDSKVKVQAAIQGDIVRVTGKNKDDLQDVMQALRAADFTFNIQFTNYR